MDEKFLYSRSGNSNPFGKCNEEIKVKIDEDTKTAITGLACASGMTVSEYVRAVLLAHAYGHVAILRKNNRANLFAPESGMGDE